MRILLTYERTDDRPTAGLLSCDLVLKNILLGIVAANYRGNIIFTHFYALCFHILITFFAELLLLHLWYNV
jgi:hypothetical protein